MSTEFDLTHIDDGQRSAEPLRFHPQQVLELRDNDVHGRRCCETSHEGLSEVNCHKSKPQNTEDKLEGCLG